MARTKNKSEKNGELIPRKNGYSGRYWALVDGERVRKCVNLHTDNRTAAQIKLDRLVAGTAEPETVTEYETFEEAARRITPELGTCDVPERIRRLEIYVFPVIGGLAVNKIRAADVKDVLSKMAEKGLSRTSCTHILAFMSNVMNQLWSDEILPENVAKRVRSPKSAKVDKRKRVLLTDEEIMRFVEHPELQPELRLMVLLARCVGGMRTSDLHAWNWEHIDWAAGDAYIPRPKTKSGDRLVLPDMVLPALRAWHAAAGSPQTGIVFPFRKGSSAGERRCRRSHAAVLRRALWKLGIRRAEKKENDPLQIDTDLTRRADFHSFRRIYNTSLARAGVNVQTAMKLAGHQRADTHMLYVRMTEATAMPEAALPKAPRVVILKPMSTQPTEIAAKSAAASQNITPVLPCDSVTLAPFNEAGMSQTEAPCLDGASS